MAVESLPDFTPPARQRWESIPSDIRHRLLANVWCGHRNDGVQAGAARRQRFHAQGHHGAGDAALGFAPSYSRHRVNTRRTSRSAAGVDLVGQGLFAQIFSTF